MFLCSQLITALHLDPPEPAHGQPGRHKHQSNHCRQSFKATRHTRDNPESLGHPPGQHEHTELPGLSTGRLHERLQYRNNSVLTAFQQPPREDRQKCQPAAAFQQLDKPQERG